MIINVIIDKDVIDNPADDEISDKENYYICDSDISVTEIIKLTINARNYEKVNEYKQ